MRGNINNVMTAIDYIESHLHEKLDLETVAGGCTFFKISFAPNVHKYDRADYPRLCTAPTVDRSRKAACAFRQTNP